jgi:hypothetical protein
MPVGLGRCWIVEKKKSRCSPTTKSAAPATGRYSSAHVARGRVQPHAGAACIAVPSVFLGNHPSSSVRLLALYVPLLPIVVNIFYYLSPSRLVEYRSFRISNDVLSGGIGGHSTTAGTDDIHLLQSRRPGGTRGRCSTNGLRVGATFSG